MRGRSCFKLPTGLHLLSNFYSNPFTEGQRDFIFTSTLFETPILVNLSRSLCKFFTFGKFYSICFFSLFSLAILLWSYYHIFFDTKFSLKFLRRVFIPNNSHPINFSHDSTPNNFGGFFFYAPIIICLVVLWNVNHF